MSKEEVSELFSKLKLILLLLIIFIDLFLCFFTFSQWIHKRCIDRQRMHFLHMPLIHLATELHSIISVIDFNICVEHTFRQRIKIMFSQINQQLDFMQINQLCELNLLEAHKTLEGGLVFLFRQIFLIDPHQVEEL